MLGDHCLKTWSATQKSISLSSGEAELVAAVKASCETIGFVQMGSEWGLEMAAEIMVDSSAALGAVKRKGNGRLRHVRVGLLWIQQSQENGELAYKKVLGTSNPADLLTKHLSRPVSEKLLEHLQVGHASGRASTSLTL